MSVTQGTNEKGTNQNILREEDIQRIISTYEKYEEKEKFSHVATVEEIQENEYNLNIPRYVDTFEEEEPIDMDAVKKNISGLKKELLDQAYY